MKNRELEVWVRYFQERVGFCKVHSLIQSGQEAFGVAIPAVLPEGAEGRILLK